MRALLILYLKHCRESRYIAYTSQLISSGPKYLSGARHFLSDLYTSFNTNRSHPLVQATITGSKKIRADPVKRKLPLRTSLLHAFLEVARCTDDYDDFLFATIISCSFYGCYQTGELVLNNNPTLRDWRKIIKRASLHISSWRAGYHLPYHKGDRFYQVTDILFSSQEIADSVTFTRLCEPQGCCTRSASGSIHPRKPLSSYTNLVREEVLRRP